MIQARAPRPAILLAGLLLSASGWPAQAEEPDAAFLSKQAKSAEGLFAKGQRAAAAANLGEALEKYRLVVRRHPLSTWAAKAQWEIARLHDDNQEYAAAFDAYQLLVEHFPGHFEQAFAAQYRLALKVIAHYDHLLRKPDAHKPRELPEKEQASSMLRLIIRNGPYAPIAAEAQYYHGIALEKEDRAAAARTQHELVMEKFPDHPLADDACFQVAYIEYKAWRRGQGPAPKQRDRAELALRDFLLRYPGSDKAAQARTLLAEAVDGQQREWLNLARFYEGQGNEKAAAVCYQILAKDFPKTVAKGSPLEAKLAILLEKYPELKPLRTDAAPATGALPEERIPAEIAPEPVPKALPVDE